MMRADESAGDFDSDFERDVYDVLRASGHRVDTQVGCGGYRIDLAIVHPQESGVYALGIECDGAAYHSGATARDRDRLRKEVLEGLGWRLHRIWSTDWIYDRAKEIDRLLEGIDCAVREGPRSARASAPAIVDAPEPCAPSSTVLSNEIMPQECVEEDDSPIVPYRCASLTIVTTDPEAMYHASRFSELSGLIVEVLRVEAPIHVDELTRRVGGAFGLQRVSARARRRVFEVLRQLPGHSLSDEFVWTEGATRSFEINVRVGGDRDPEILPPEEIAAAARWVLSRAFSMPMTDLVRETARVFGIQRLGAKVDARMRLGIELLMEHRLCTRDGERAIWGDSRNQNS